MGIVSAVKPTTRVPAPAAPRHRRRTGSAAWAAAIAALALFVAACSTAPKLDPGQAAPEPEKVGGAQTFVVVVFRGDPDLAAASRVADWTARGDAVVRALQQTADRAQADARSRLDAAGIRYRTLWIANALALDGTDELPKELEGLPGVSAVYSGKDATLAQLVPSSAFRTTPAPAPGTLWYRDALGLDALAASGADGDGTTLGIVDTGVDATHPALADNFVGTSAHGWFDPTGVCPDAPCDPIGHGTHVAGLAVGDGVGVAPAARWIAARGCATESCQLDDVLAALQFMLAPTEPSGSRPDPARRPQVLLSSWALPNPLVPLERATSALQASGVVQVFAAGDAGPACGTVAAPATDRGVISVGATGPSGTIDPLSSRGPSPVPNGEEVEPVLAAPGRDIVSTYPGDGWATASGTSMAAPLVAGTALLLVQRDVDLVGDPAAVGRLLTSTATPRSDTSCGPVTADGADNVYGHGTLAPAKALDAAGTRGR